MKAKEILFIFIIIAIILFILINNPFNSINILIIQNKYLKKINTNIDNIEINELTLNNSTYYYNLLNDKEKEIYKRLSIAVKNMQDEVFLENVDLENINYNISKSVNYFFNDHPEVFYISNKYAISSVNFLGNTYAFLNLNYEYNKDQIKDKLNKINIEIKEILNEVIKFNDDYSKELYLHDYLANKIDYYDEINLTNEEKYHNIDTVFLENLGVCDGISKTFQILLDKCGIESILVTGKINNNNHAWNLVKIKNRWYNVDLTSDKFIKQKIGNKKVIVHSYFNVTSNMLKKSHKFDNINLQNLSVSVDENFYLKENFHIFFEDIFENKLRKIVESQKKSNILEFSTDYSFDISKKILNELYNINFDNYFKNNFKVNMKYYKIGKNYIILKN